MGNQLRRISSLGIIMFFMCASISSQSIANKPLDPSVAQLGDGFASGLANVNGTTLHFVRGGMGPALVLLHGFPQDWYEWHKVMPRLAKQFTVIAVDLRGISESKATKAGYESANLAEDIHQLVQQLKLNHVYVVGHDLGGQVAYALARLHPEDLRGVMVMETPIPGIDPWEKVKADPKLWHVNFQQVPNLPEQLIAGRQTIYFSFFFHMSGVANAITDADLAHYVKAYSSPAQLRSGFEIYRAFPADEKFNAERRSEINVPLVLAGGDLSFGKLLPNLKDTLKMYGWQNVTVEIMENSAHYVADEQPDKVAALIERYAKQ
jgi:pimeloyl-ACP methyl ester carboxylesterase